RRGLRLRAGAGHGVSTKSRDIRSWVRRDGGGAVSSERTIRPAAKSLVCERATIETARRVRARESDMAHALDGEHISAENRKRRDWLDQAYPDPGGPITPRGLRTESPPAERPALRRAGPPRGGGPGGTPLPPLPRA